MSAHIVIVGAGVAGLSTAYYCAKRGLRVTVVERSAPKRDGASFGNAGMIVPSHFIPLAAPGMVALGLKWMWNPASPFYIKPRLDGALFDWAYKFWRAATPAHVKRAAPLIADLSLESRKCFEEIAAQPALSIGLERVGLLMLCQQAQTLEEESHTAAKARELGIPAEVLDAPATIAKNPRVPAAVAGSIFFPLDCHLSPSRFVQALEDECLRLGVAFRWAAPAARFEVSGRKVGALVLESGERVTGDEFVLCGGSWSPDLVANLGLRIPMQAGKGYSLTLRNPKQQLSIPSILTEARVAVTPMGDTLRVGGTMEIAGRDLGVNPVRVRGIVDSFCRYFPSYRPDDFAGVTPWSGLRPCSPDGLPYVGRTSRLDNFTLATGHAMMGLSLAPITGKLIAGVLTGEKPAAAHALMSPDRY